jgi:ribose 5-phosphate isomerase RpiB
MLEDFRRQGVDIRLPKDSLVTPAARDWLKEHPVPVVWEDEEQSACSLAVVMDTSLPEMRAMRTMLDQMGSLAEVIEAGDGRGGIISATRRLCGMLVRKDVAKGVVFAVDGALPVCLANKHKGIRAGLGVNVPMVEEACRELGINLLVMEYPEQTTFQMKQMIDRLINCTTPGNSETLRLIASIEQGDGRADR